MEARKGIVGMKNFVTYQVALEATQQMAGCLTVDQAA